jgi:hypothetical protein
MGNLKPGGSTMAEFNEKTVRTWMQNQAYLYEDKETGETNHTALAEAAAAAFNQNEIGGPLDDESHWIWELAARF